MKAMNKFELMLMAFRKVAEEDLGRMMRIAFEEGIENNGKGLYRNEIEGEFNGETLMAKYGDIVRSAVQRLMKVTVKRYKSIIDGLIENEHFLGKTACAASRHIVMVQRTDITDSECSAIDGATRLEAIMYSFKSGYRWDELKKIPFTVSTYMAGSDMAEMILFKYLNCAKPISAKDNAVAYKIATGRYVIALLCRNAVGAVRDEYAKLVCLENRSQAVNELETIVASELVANGTINLTDPETQDSIRNMDDFKNIIPYSVSPEETRKVMDKAVERGNFLNEHCEWLMSSTPWERGPIRRGSKKIRQLSVVGGALTMAGIPAEAFVERLSTTEATTVLQNMLLENNKSLTPPSNGKDLEGYIKQMKAYSKVFTSFMEKGVY